MKTIIFHIDVNSAFLSWEAVERLKRDPKGIDLRMVPSAVGGDMATRHGVILAKSIPAKKYQVRTGEPVVDALRKCPDLLLVKPNHELYRRNSDAFMAILRKYSDVVEQFSVDEAFIDMTGTEKLFGAPVAAAERIKEEIYDALGFTVNIGISTNKLLAKMASDFEKPNRVHTLFPEEIERKMWPLPVGDLLFVGKSSEKKLRSIGIHTIGDLAGCDPAVLRNLLKKQGETIWEFANGRDASVLKPEAEANKCYSNSTTLSADITDAAAAKKVLLSLSESVAARLRRDGARIEVVAVEIRFQDLSRISHQRMLPPTNITDEIHRMACCLFDEMWDGTPIRLLGVQTSHISEDDSRQLSLFDTTDYEKLKRLDAAVDRIRSRYGSDAVKRASFLDPGKKE